MKPTLIPDADVLTALGRLNSYVRSEAHRRRLNDYSATAVYAMKLAALHALASSGAFAFPDTFRLERVDVRCRVCSGTGTWRSDYDPGYTDECRSCGGSGRKRLRFLVSTLPDGQVWHTPQDRAGGLASAVLGEYDFRYDPELRRYVTRYGGVEYDFEPAPVGGWVPNQPGADLDAEAVAAALNLVEPWFLDADPSPTNRPGWRAGLTRHEAVIVEERLHAGFLPDCCVLCGHEVQAWGEKPEGDERERVNEGRTTPDRPVRWIEPLCRPCYAGGASIHYEADEPPAVLFTEAVRAWWERHKALRASVLEDTR